MSPSGPTKNKKTVTANKIRGGIRNSSIHLQRYSLHKLGKSTEEIALLDGVKEETVRDSLARIDAFRTTNTVEFLNESVIGVVMENTQKMSSALGQGLQAMTKDKAGKRVPDHVTRGKFLDTAAKIVQTVQPKAAPNFKVSVNQQSAVVQGASGKPMTESSFVGYEERLRKIRRKIDEHNQLPPVTANVKDDDSELEDDVAEEVTLNAGGSDTQGQPLP